MVNMLNNDNLDLFYKEPNRYLICYEYWKDIVHKKLRILNMRIVSPTNLNVNSI